MAPSRVGKILELSGNLGPQQGQPCTRLCHNCARHIVAAGLRRVVFIEPYPKSQAGKLHKDAIQLDYFPHLKKRGGVPFDAFVGVGPRRYTDLFAIRMVGGFAIERKDEDGRVIP